MSRPSEITSPTPDQRYAGRDATSSVERRGHALVADDSAEAAQDVRPFAVRLDELRRTHNLTFRALEAWLEAYVKPGERAIHHSHLWGSLLVAAERPLRSSS